MIPQDKKIQAITQLVENDSGVLASAIIGSQARTEFIADEYSDIIHNEIGDGNE